MRRIFPLLLLWAIGWQGCTPAPQGIAGLSLADARGQVHSLDSLAAKGMVVLVFFSPECPLCENYAPVLQALADSFAEQGVQFAAVFPGEWYPNEQIRRFMLHYGVQFPALLDPDEVLTRRLKATTTPEVCVFLNPEQAPLYRGKIDNWIVSLGKKRTVVTERYLANALTAALNGLPVNPTQTEPVGCLIQLKN